MIAFFFLLGQAAAASAPAAGVDPWAMAEHVFAGAAFLAALFSWGKWSKWQKLAKATFAGIRVGLADKVSGKPPEEAIADAIRASATELGVSDHAAEHLDGGLGPPPAPPTLSPGAGPGVKS